MTQNESEGRKSDSPAQVTFPVVVIVVRMAEVIMVLSTPPLGWPFPKSFLRLPDISV